MTSLIFPMGRAQPATRLWRAPLPRAAGPGTCGLPGACQRSGPAGGPTPHPQDGRIIANLPDGVLREMGGNVAW